MKIITCGEAMRIHRQHPASRLFRSVPANTAGCMAVLDTGTGREVQDIPGVLAFVFAERRKDSFGRDVPADERHLN